MQALLESRYCIQSTSFNTAGPHLRATVAGSARGAARQTRLCSLVAYGQSVRRDGAQDPPLLLPAAPLPACAGATAAPPGALVYGPGLYIMATLAATHRGERAALDGPDPG